MRSWLVSSRPRPSVRVSNPGTVQLPCMRPQAKDASCGATAANAWGSFLASRQGPASSHSRSRASSDWWMGMTAAAPVARTSVAASPPRAAESQIGCTQAALTHVAIAYKYRVGATSTRCAAYNWDCWRRPHACVHARTRRALVRSVATKHWRRKGILNSVATHVHSVGKLRTHTHTK